MRLAALISGALMTFGMMVCGGYQSIEADLMRAALDHGETPEFLVCMGRERKAQIYLCMRDHGLIDSRSRVLGEDQ